ncbi:acyltransferase [Fructobacillus sp. M1-13]|uniref:Acyltransferase n=1 Tax=Fructobacillus papyriferae TaxID=2713171 RepID=A0ABS5QP91_9LACO|nr:acyltransferase [Fructobacillus papyriferae]MBS9334886.1 acyltransferase [Fructobacillus papyriferae]MCD2158876.1 acyltransferase [Fructobacillus papyriferae]
MNTEIKSQKVRNSNLEFLRIIAMLLIVAHHFALHGFEWVDTSSLSGGIDVFILDFFRSGGKLGVDIFVLISGYFVSKKAFTLKKFLLIYAQIWFYSVGIFLLFTFCLHPFFPITKIDAFYNFFPLIYNRYWFATNFIFLMALSPLLNVTFKYVKQPVILRILLLAVLFCSFLPTFFNVSAPLSYLGWFILLYMVAGYIRYFVDIHKLNHKKHILFTILSVSALYIMSIVNSKYWDLHSFIVLVSTVEIFIMTITAKPRYNRMVNLISGSTFGVYLIHDNPYMRRYIWHTLFNVQSFYHTGFRLFPFAIAVIATIFIFSILIDMVRRYTVQRLWGGIVDNIDMRQYGNHIYFILKSSWNRISKKQRELFFLMAFLQFIFFWQIIFPTVGRNIYVLIYNIVNTLINTAFFIIPLLAFEFIIFSVFLNKSFKKKKIKFHNTIFIIEFLLLSFFIAFINKHLSKGIVGLLLKYNSGDSLSYFKWIVILSICFFILTLYKVVYWLRRA